MASRYQQRALYAERGGVTTYEGLDPLTGLPVLIYRFAGQPAKGLETLESENIPGVLELGREGGESRVVVAYSRDYRPLVHPLGVAPSLLLLDSARALRDAAAAGVRHGDLRPVRFLASREHVLVEGFGIPWQAEPNPYRAPEPKPSLAADVFAWAKAMLDLCGGNLAPEVQALLERCLAEKPEARPDAAGLYQELSEALARQSSAARGPSHVPDLEGELRFEAGTAKQEAERPNLELELPSAEPDPEGAEPAEEAPPAPARPKPSAPKRDPKPREHQPEVIGAWGESDTDPLLVVSDPGLRPPPAPRREGQPRPNAPTPKPPERGFVKTLPPGATYRAGEEEPRPYLRPGSLEEYTFDDERRGPPRRRFVLLGLLLVAATALALLAVWQQRRDLAPVGGSASVSGNYVVTVTLEPSDLPPVTLYVVSSPEGSRWEPGAGIRTLSAQQPSELLLDRSGVWRLQARYDDRASEVATVEVPAQRAVTIVMPAPASP